MRRCEYAKCGDVLGWRFVDAEMCRCGDVKMWRCGDVEIWRCVDV